jgi:naphthoate synthase
MSSINWKTAKEYQDLTYKKADGVARIAFNRPEVRNAFRPQTVSELIDAFYDAQEDLSIGVVVLTGEGPSPKDGGWAFCSGGDQNARGKDGYKDSTGTGRLNILEVQRMIRFMPKVVICAVPGWAVGGGHSLHVVWEIFFLGRNYNAQEAMDMGMVNAVVPHDQLDQTAYDWAQEIMEKSPTAIKMAKFALNATDDGMVGQQVFAGEMTRLIYMTDEAKEGRDAFLEKRKPDFGKNQWLP